ncbi:uncharacterized protein LOC113330493 [Papaver somniferum]|uniref:uncharacterized protein LOC113330493 n=1 Tax=Papaver somniferum TaxID=3469 RepID=UPI000E7049EF|nr:uncharacterized protein LOC113330493 [Papaver somniferum]
MEKMKKRWNFTAVYGATDPADYEKFWQEVDDIRLMLTDPWLIGGDWNAVLYPNERNNSGGCTRSRRCFRKFINNHNLIDIPMSGNTYKPPFRFEYYYLSHPDFLENMRVWWNNLTFFGSPSFNLAKKLQALKFFIKKWGRETFGSLQIEVDNLEKLIDVYDSLEEINALNEDDFTSRETTKVQHNKASLNLARKWHARTKGQWLADGERNSKFFHKNASYNQTVYSINSLLINGVISHDKNLINEEAKRFYENVFTESVG